MSELVKLKTLSARVGADPLLVQAAGGNTSLKANGTMWIKASGTWLKDALTRNIFVSLDHAAVMNALAANDPAAESCAAFVTAEDQASGLRPSIETTVHAAMPQAVVVHVHCVNTIAHAVCRDSVARLTPLLKDFNWAYVPYARPGLPLAGAIAGVMRPGVEVLVLGNHGLVVAAETVAAAENLLNRVVAAVTIRPRAVAKPDLAALAKAIAGTEYTLPEDAETHALALDDYTLSVGGADVFYPDHVVFLGTTIATTLASQAKLVAWAGKGVVVRKDAAPSVTAMGRCLADVFLRLEPGSPLNALTADDVYRLTNWDAEKYRQTLKAT